MSSKKSVSLAAAQELLSQSKAQWVCPITGVKFDLGDVHGIEEHKKTLLERLAVEEQKKDAAAEKRKIKKDFKESLHSMESLGELEDAVAALVEKIKADGKKYDFSIELVHPKLNARVVNVSSYYGTVAIVSSQPTESVLGSVIPSGVVVRSMPLKTLSGKTTRLIINLPRRSFLFDKVCDFYKNYKGSPKLSKEEKEKLIKENVEYALLSKQVSEIAARIHVLRQDVSAKIERMGFIRTEALGHSGEVDWML